MYIHLFLYFILYKNIFNIHKHNIFFLKYLHACVCIYIRGVNFNALTHVINKKKERVNIFLTQIIHLIRFDPNFFPSSQRGRLSISVWWGYSEQCCQGSGCGTSDHGLFWKYSRGKNYRAEGCVFLECTLYLATSERRGACNITNNVNFSQSIQGFTQQK